MTKIDRLNSAHHLLTLPLEIRERIYLLCLQDIAVGDRKFVNIVRPPPYPLTIDFTYGKPDLLPPLLSTCAQIHDELWKVIWTKMQFRKRLHLCGNCAAFPSNLDDVEKLKRLAQRYAAKPVDLQVHKNSRTETDCEVILSTMNIEFPQRDSWSIWGRHPYEMSLETYDWLKKEVEKCHEEAEIYAMIGLGRPIP